MHAFLIQSRTIAVVGLSAREKRDSHAAAAYLAARGFRVLGINPAHRELLGEPCHASLSAMPPELRSTIDLVLVFRRPEAVPPLIEEMARLGLRRAWIGSDQARCADLSLGFFSGGFRKAPSPPWRSHVGFTPMSSPPARKTAEQAYFWRNALVLGLAPGVSSPGALAAAARSGIEVVAERCIRVEHEALEARA